MDLHLNRHHGAQVAAANRALAQLPELAALPVAVLLRRLPRVDLPDPVRATLRNSAGGHHNHSLFWEILAPAAAAGAPSEALAADLARTFGSLDKFREQFNQAAMARFGSGWAWLSRRDDGTLLVHSTANQDSPLMEGLTPLLGLDVWEHAYYLRYQNRRADYVAAFWSVVNWSRVSELHAAQA
jgi:Fe-Mn family superoxide dismutase